MLNRDKDFFFDRSCSVGEFNRFLVDEEFVFEKGYKVDKKSLEGIMVSCINNNGVCINNKVRRLVKKIKKQ